RRRRTRRRGRRGRPGRRGRAASGGGHDRGGLLRDRPPAPVAARENTDVLDVVGHVLPLLAAQALRLRAHDRGVAEDAALDVEDLEVRVVERSGPVAGQDLGLGALAAGRQERHVVVVHDAVVRREVAFGDRGDELPRETLDFERGGRGRRLLPRGAARRGQENAEEGEDRARPGTTHGAPPPADAAAPLSGPSRALPGTRRTTGPRRRSPEPSGSWTR